MRERIFEPSEMDHTDLVRSDREVPTPRQAGSPTFGTRRGARSAALVARSGFRLQPPTETCSVHGTVLHADDAHDGLFRFPREHQSRSIRGRAGAVLISLSHSQSVENEVLSGLALVAQFQNGLSRSQTKHGACRSEPLAAGEHVLDRLGQLAGEHDLRDIRAAPASETTFGALVALFVERV